MFETIKNGFNAILDFINVLINFIYRIVSAGVQLINLVFKLPSAFNTAVELLPTVLIAAALFCISVRLLVIFLNKDAGGD